MKVLWFTNTPCNADEYFNSELKGSGGWLKSLDQAIQEKIELHIVFYHPECSAPFKYKETYYYPIQKKKKPLIKKYLDKKAGSIIHKEDVSLYMSIINQVNPNIIHIHGTENPFGYIIKKTSIPVVISIQGCINVCYQKFLGDFNKRDLKRSKTATHAILRLFPFRDAYKKMSKMMIRESEILSNSRNIIGRTNWDYRVSRILASESKYHYSSEMLRPVFYNNVWNPRNSMNSFIFTTSGNIMYKGFETLCHALYLINHKSRNNFKWYVAGISENDLIVKITKIKMGKNYPLESLKLLGRLNSVDLVSNMLKAGIYVMPSHIENSPNNLSEAMILGMPCIATYAGGTGSLLDDRKEGLLIQDGDPFVMAGAILELHKDINTSIELGKMARRRALKRHNRESIVSDLLETYNSILKDK